MADKERARDVHRRLIYADEEADEYGILIDTFRAIRVEAMAEQREKEEGVAQAAQDYVEAPSNELMNILLAKLDEYWGTAD